MQRVNEYEFYELAIAIHPLTTVANTALYSEVWYDWFNARALLSDTFVNRRPLSICRPAAEKLFSAISAFVPEEWVDAVAKYPSPPDVSPVKVDHEVGFLAYSVRESAKQFETILQAELQAMDTYHVTQRGSYKTFDLVDRARITIPKAIRELMPEQAQIDFDQAGKCLAFDTPTAAGFHVLRSTESIIRQYYEAVTGVAPKPQMRNWGAYLRNLRNCKAESKILDLLEHIRIAYRNPVLHPEENLTIDQAQVLFGVCVSAVMLMVEETRRLADKGIPLQFPAPDALGLGSGS